MRLEPDALVTLALTIVVLMAGRAVIARVSLLQRYNLPEPVVGGLLAALLITALRFGADLDIRFDLSLQTPLMLAFFATVGLGADFGTLLRGGRGVLLFLAVLAGMLVLQNLVGLAAAWSMDLHPLAGMLAGSITMMGGHGTGAAYATRFVEQDNLQGAMEMAMACATFGLVLGGMVGGPIAQRLIKRHRLVADGGSDALHDAAETSGKPVLTAPLFLESLLWIVICVVVGSYLGRVLQNDVLTLPSFVWTLFTGVLLRNGLGAARLRQIDDASVSLLGTVALSLFLAMALISLRLWELVALALPILAILALQTLLVVVYTYTVTFRVMGGNYDAAVLCAGCGGIGLGATPTAIANMQAITGKYGPSPQAFLILPIVGAFLIDLTNALTIQGFLSLPVFGF